MFHYIKENIYESKFEIYEKNAGNFPIICELSGRASTDKQNSAKLDKYKQENAFDQFLFLVERLNLAK